MIDQPALFDLSAGEQLAADGMRQAREAERVETWVQAAGRILEQLAATGRPFTADDLIARVGLPDVGTNRNNAVGAVVSCAARSGLIVRTGYRPSERTATRGRVVAVWQGLTTGGRS